MPEEFERSHDRFSLFPPPPRPLWFERLFNCALSKLLLFLFFVGSSHHFFNCTDRAIFMNSKTSGVSRPLTPAQAPENRSRENPVRRAPLVMSRSLSLLYPVSSTLRQRLRAR
jgi:hypothetical protein